MKVTTMTHCRQTTITGVLALCALLATTAAHPECPPPDPGTPLAEGQIGLFFDPAGTTRCADVAPFAQFTLYLVVRVPEGGIAEFEIPELLAVSAPPGLLFLNTSLPDGSLYDLHVYNDECSRGHRPDEMECPVTQGEILTIAKITMMAGLGGEAVACFQTGCSELAGPVAGPPQYTRCDGELATFAGWDALCVGFGTFPLATHETTWGAVKALYR
jgi:hypothetical protein